MNWYETLIHFLENNFFACPIKQQVGIDCLGCGFQRSFILLLKGDWYGSWKMYPALVPMLLMFLFLPIHVKFKIKNGHKILLALFILSSFLCVANFMLKLTSIQ